MDEDNPSIIPMSEDNPSIRLFTPHAIQLKVTYHRLGIAVGLAFVATTLFSAIITFTSTEYSPETDLVFRFYEAFNPCILFDHYPANLFGVLGISCVVCLQIGQVMLLWLHRKAIETASPSEEHRPWASLMYSIAMGPVIVLYLCFVNIFPANLYSHDHAYTVHNASLVADNATVDMKEGITPEIFEAVSLHTLWFILYLVADMVFAALVWSYAASLRQSSFPAWPKPRGCRVSRAFKAWRSCVGVLYFIGVFLFAASMTIMIFTYDGEDRWNTGQNRASAHFVQKAVLWLQSKSRASLWSLLLVWFPGHAPIALPRELGIQITMSLESNPWSANTTGLFSTVCPSKVLASCCMLLAVLLLVTLSMVDTPDTSTSIDTNPLFVGFRSHPWVFLFVPCWFSITMLLGVSSVLTWARVELLARAGEAKRWRVLGTAAMGALVFVFAALALWVSIPMFNPTRWIGSGLAILIPLFLAVSHVLITGPPPSGLSIVALPGFLLVAGALGFVSWFSPDTSAVALALEIVMLAFLGTVVKYGSNLPSLYMHVDALKYPDDALSHKEQLELEAAVHLNDEDISRRS